MKKKRLITVSIGIFVAACAGGPIAPDSPGGEMVIEAHEVLILESFPMRLQLSLAGRLPTECHTLEWEVAPPGETGRIEVSVFAAASSQGGCDDAAQPFRVSIGLGSFTGGEYSIWLNGQLISEVNLGEPQGDDPRTEAGVYIDTAEVVSSQQGPTAVISGQLPTACHELEWSVSVSSEGNDILLDLRSQADPQMMCTLILEPFEAELPLGSLAQGSYSLVINSVYYGDFEVSGESTQGWVRSAAFVDSVEILLLESFPVQVRLLVKGSLPTPCHKLAWDLNAGSEEGRIDLELYSLSDPELDCIQILEAFEESIPMGSYGSGEYEVWVNGESVGEFDI